MGRQPWVVAPNPTGIPEVRLLTAQAASESVSSAMVWITLIGFTGIYLALMVVELFLLKRYITAGPDAVLPPEAADREDDDEPSDSDEQVPPTLTNPTEREADVLAFAY